MSDTPDEGLWVEVEGYTDEDGKVTTERYYVDDTYEIDWKGKDETYAVLIREEDYPAYAAGSTDVVPDILRYSEEKDALVDIDDEDEKEHAIDEINAFVESQEA